MLIGIRVLLINQLIRLHFFPPACVPREQIEMNYLLQFALFATVALVARAQLIPTSKVHTSV